MNNRERIGETMQQHYQDVWLRDDPWDFETSEFEQLRFARQLQVLGTRRYARVLEIGCGAGVFTDHLTSIADHVVALDIAPAAIERAKRRRIPPAIVDFRVANIMEYDARAEGPWDLIVMSETIYCLGWLYSFFDISWRVAELLDTLREGGRFLLANTYGGEQDYLLLPWLIDTYRDLFVNIGYRLESEEVFKGVKDGVDIEVLLSLFTRGPN
jgi:SAM-dependent methyltransferase